MVTRGLVDTMQNIMHITRKAQLMLILCSNTAAREIHLIHKTYNTHIHKTDRLFYKYGIDIEFVFEMCNTQSEV